MSSWAVAAWVVLCLVVVPAAAVSGERFEGRFYRGEGDVEYLTLLDISRRMFDADPELQNAAMLYTPRWNGFVEGPTWGAWWIQNSYGPTYCALPFYAEPYVTFLQNAQDLWFDQMGDGTRTWRWRKESQELVIPDGQLCDAASPDWFIPKQGDGRVDIHDWGVEFTAAGLLMQAELLLISRDAEAIAHYLPKLERCANFLAMLGKFLKTVYEPRPFRVGFVLRHYPDVSHPHTICHICGGLIQSLAPLDILFQVLLFTEVYISAPSDEG